MFRSACLGEIPEIDWIDFEKSLGIVSTAYTLPAASAAWASLVLEMVHEKPAAFGPVSWVTSWRPARICCLVPSGAVVVTMVSWLTTIAGMASMRLSALLSAPAKKPATSRGTAMTPASNTPVRRLR
jgi:hypothetical protein